jgi:hypothetical protein
LNGSAAEVFWFLRDRVAESLALPDRYHRNAVSVVLLAATARGLACFITPVISVAAFSSKTNLPPLAKPPVELTPESLMMIGRVQEKTVPLWIQF